MFCSNNCNSNRFNNRGYSNNCGCSNNSCNCSNSCGCASRNYENCINLLPERWSYGSGCTGSRISYGRHCN